MGNAQITAHEITQAGKDVLTLKNTINKLGMALQSFGATLNRDVPAAIDRLDEFVDRLSDSVAEIAIVEGEGES